MANVVRFTLPTARSLYIRGVGHFVAGVLDIPVSEPENVARARYLTPPYGAVEVGTVAAGTAAPALPAAPGTVVTDPFPQYVTDSELANPASGSVAALQSTLGTVFKVPAPTGVRATDTANIVAQATAAQAVGGGTVLLQPGTYKTNAALPILPGVTYRGTPPVLRSDNVTNTVYMPDSEFHFIGGTVIQGNGTHRGFQGNATDQASVSATIGDTQIAGAGIIGIGLEGFTDGIKIGAVNIIGLVFSKIDEVYVRDCSGWAVFLANFQHIEIGTLRASSVANGYYFGALLPSATLNPGNSLFRELFLKVSGGNRKSRGIVFDAVGTLAILGEIHVLNAQVNAFNRTMISVTAGLTSGSANVTVPDGTVWQAGMLASFSTATGGFLANTCYIVKSVVGNTITLADSRRVADKTANATTTGTLRSWGMPHMEIIAQPGATGLQSGRFHNLDFEGQGSAGLYVEGANFIEFSFSAVPVAQAVIVGRGASYCSFYSSIVDASTDFDGPSSVGSTFTGSRRETYGYPLRGMWRDGVLNTEVLSIGPGISGRAGGDLHRRANGMLFPAAGIGIKTLNRDDTPTGLDPSHTGAVVFAGSVGNVYSLPNLTESTTSDTPGNTIGTWYEIYNVGTATCTVNTNAGQLLNKVTGKTSTTIAPGNMLKLIATKSQDGTLFWVARLSSLTLP